MPQVAIKPSSRLALRCMAVDEAGSREKAKASKRRADKRRARYWETRFKSLLKAERRYAATLTAMVQKIRQIARTVLHMATDPVAAANHIRGWLNHFSVTIEPWARTVATKMWMDIARRDATGWRDMSEEIGKALTEEFQTAETGRAAREWISAQVDLIASVPRDIGVQIQKKAVEAVAQGTRGKSLAEFIEQHIRPELNLTFEQAKRRAKMIARTETGRATTALTMARAKEAGSTEYIWRTMQDGNVRDTHAKLNGTVHGWDSPPECDPGYRAHPGCIWNCRCYAEPIFRG